MSKVPRGFARPLSRALCRQCPSRRLTVRFSSNQTNPPDDSRSSLSEQAAQYIDSLQLKALAATQRLNEITGYTPIEALKSQIQEQGHVRLSLANNRE